MSGVAVNVDQLEYGAAAYWYSILVSAPPPMSVGSEYVTCREVVFRALAETPVGAPGTPGTRMVAADFAIAEPYAFVATIRKTKYFIDCVAVTASVSVVSFEIAEHVPVRVAASAVLPQAYQL